MRPGRVALYAALLAVFAVVSVLAGLEHGYLGLWKFTWAGTANRQMFLDLFIASFLVLSWMLADARTSGVRAWPYVVLTVLTGSFGLLGYLLHRELKRPRAQPVA